MTEAFTINHEELAILCDFVGGWGGKWAANNLQTVKRQTLDLLITNGFPVSAVTSRSGVLPDQKPGDLSLIRNSLKRPRGKWGETVSNY
jgi:hypothetical protein